MKGMSLVSGLAILAVTGGVGAALASGSGAHWGYEGEAAPNNWAGLSHDYNACGEGSAQSPVNIATSDAVEADLPALEINWSMPATEVINNGHTIQVNFPEGNSVTIGDKTYNLAQFHFHHVSEHTVDGNPYPLEAHFVHFAPDGKSAAVVGVLFNTGDENETIETVWEAMPEHEGEATSEAAIDPTGMLPSDLGYYNYSGSLTTPPCSEIINWVVLKTPMTVSAEQISEFAELFTMNMRPVQPLNDRVVSVSK